MNKGDFRSKFDPKPPFNDETGREN